jgi:hypothetical protein
MALAFVKSAKGTSSSSTVSWGFGSATTSGNLIVGVIAADDYNATPTTGWTQSSEMEQQGYHGAYLWWRISTGETSPQAYTIGSATVSAWILMEFSGNDATPYDTSQGLIVNSTDETYTTDNITPTSGNRLLVAMVGGSLAGDLSAYVCGGWTNSFTTVDHTNTGNTGATNDIIGAAYRIVAADGSTAYSTTGDFDTGSAAIVQSRSALIISFKESASSQSNAPRAMQHFRRRR